HNLDHDLLEEDPGREARKDVTKVAEALAAALDQGTMRAQVLPVSGAAELLATLERTRPDLVINLCESLAADSRGEMAVPLLLELLRLPYTGSPALALGLALHKHKAKEVLLARGISTPRFALAERLEDLVGLELPFPLIVKPSREDASVGVDFDSVVGTRAQLERAVRAVLNRFRQPALVEQYVDGPEVYVPLLGNRGGGARTGLPLTEIRFGPAFSGRPRILSYRAKWEAGSAECKDSPAVPCTLGSREQERLRALATAAFDALECQDYGRVDLRLASDGSAYVIDVNPNCDLHPEAGFARAAAAAGITYRALAVRLVEIALERSYGNTPARRAGPAVARRAAVANRNLLAGRGHLRAGAHRSRASAE
ncbi:MAG TPA: D-alanine--D-alanine ligase, partial [Myxococcales bacterium]|nr:D-alanine--D-alanine ligase [Myxococcales bacterium]